MQKKKLSEVLDLQPMRLENHQNLTPPQMVGQSPLLKTVNVFEHTADKIIGYLHVKFVLYVVRLRKDCNIEHLQSKEKDKGKIRHIVIL